MARELNFRTKSVGIIGAGPAGIACANFLKDFADITVFDKGKFLRTILPTGGGRCNLTYKESDFKLFAQNYPRGEKFLYSVLSRFGYEQTIDFFSSIGVDTYFQPDNRVFPCSNSAADVRDKMLKNLEDISFQKEEVLKIEKKGDFFEVITNKSKYAFDYVVISIGGHSNFNLLKTLGIRVVPPVPALVGFVTDLDFSELSGVSLCNVEACVFGKVYKGDMIFTHKGLSGPLIYKISSIFARKDFPYNIVLNFLPHNYDLQKILNSNPHKEIKNVIYPKALGEYILDMLQIDKNLLCHKVNGNLRDIIVDKLSNFEVGIVKNFNNGEVVTCGGVDLKVINSKTMESKDITDLYFCGEVIDVDGFCGGFNLQNCWAGAYIVSQSIIKKVKSL